MTLLRFIFAALIALAPAGAAALSLEFPSGAKQTVRTINGIDTYSVPVSVMSGDDMLMITAEGMVTAEAWRIPASTLSTFEITKSLRQQLEDAGFEILVECETDQCGGFDFRYRLDLLPEPEMHVDLGDFRYLTARRASDAGDEFVSLIVSRGGQSAFVQITRVDPSAELENVIVTSTMSTPQATIENPENSGSLEDLLTTVGRVTLDDIEFAPGSSHLVDGNFASLSQLAEWLQANPDMTIALVGHTDAQGTLIANMALSKKRAQSVKRRLVEDFGISPERIEAQGVGYLVPLASNLTQEGRDKNRRVEVVLTSTR